MKKASNIRLCGGLVALVALLGWLWSGAVWAQTLGFGRGITVRAVQVFDDGGGPALYAGGSFLSAGEVQANRIAKWDGTRWSTLGRGME